MEQSIDMVPFYDAKSVKGKIVYIDHVDYGKETVQAHVILENHEKCIVTWESFEAFYQDFPEYRR